MVRCGDGEGERIEGRQHISNSVTHLHSVEECDVLLGAQIEHESFLYQQVCESAHYYVSGLVEIRANVQTRALAAPDA